MMYNIGYFCTSPRRFIRLGETAWLIGYCAVRLVAAVAAVAAYTYLALMIARLLF